jgi:hypothetical protein
MEDRVRNLWMKSHKREKFEQMSESGAECEMDGIQIHLERRIEMSWDPRKDMIWQRALMNIRRDEGRNEDIQKPHNSVNLTEISAFSISSNEKEAYVYLRSLNNLLTLFPPLLYFVCDKPALDRQETSDRWTLAGDGTCWIFLLASIFSPTMRPFNVIVHLTFLASHLNSRYRALQSTIFDIGRR